MSVLGLLDFSEVEKEVMMFISRNSGKLCTIHSIYNDILEERSINNPEIKNDLKVKLQIVMSQLNSKQSNVTVVKRNDCYLVGYNMDMTREQSNPPVIKEGEQFDTSGLAKTMFEYIVDNNIDYSIGPDCNGENLLFVGIMLGDYVRVRKLKAKLNVSFFDKNSDGKNLMDLHPTNLFVHQQCIEELDQGIKDSKKKENEYLAQIVRVNNEILNLEHSVKLLQLEAQRRNVFDIYLIAIIFFILWFLKW